MDHATTHPLPDATAYVAALFAPPDVRGVADGVPLGTGGVLDHDDLLAIAGTARHPHGVSAAVADEDLVLRARLCAFCVDVGMGMAQSLALLRDEPHAVDPVRYRGLVASVAVVAAPRVAEAARRIAVVAEATMAVAAAAGVPTLDQRDRRIPGDGS